MKTYFSDIIPKIRRFSQELDNLTLLTNQHWVVIDDIDKRKNVYIFRQNNELLISQNGRVEKAKWEYLGHNSLLIERKDESFLFKHGFFDENILALKLDGTEGYAFMVNETRYDKELNSIETIVEFLNEKYIADPTGALPGNKQPNKNHLNYVAPKYKIIDTYEDYSLIDGALEISTIEYEDGKKGTIYSKKEKRQAYFKARPKEFSNDLIFLYNDFYHCKIALHYFIVTGEILPLGLVNR